jgi:hypothetical protein
MQTPLTIPKDPVYPPSMDWNLLRREGIKHIERLGSMVWTDYNVHDPGITILEVLCYALTDLGYRANLPAADIFSGIEGKPFYSAVEILPCRPVTALDLRKVLIDIPGVQNAWVEQMEEPEVRFWFGGPVLKTEDVEEELDPYLKIFIVEQKNIPVLLRILVDEEKIKTTHDCATEKVKQQAREDLKRDFVDKALARIEAYNPLSDVVQIKKMLIKYMIDHYPDETTGFLEEELIGSGLATEETLFFYDTILSFFTDINELINYDWTKTHKPGTNGETLLQLIEKLDILKTFFYAEPLLSLMLTSNLGFTTAPGAQDTVPSNYYNLFIPQGIYNVSLKLEPGAEVDTSDIVTEALKRLHRHRNLDEDFDPDIRIVETIHIGMELTLGISPSMDKMEVLSNVYRAIQNYLAPVIRFYSLEEILNKYGVFILDAAALDDLEEAMVPAEIVEALKGFQDKEFTGDDAFKRAIASALDEDSFDDYYPDIFVHAKKLYDADPVYRGPLLQHGFVDEEELAAAQPRQTLYRSDLYQLIAAVEGVIQVHELRMYDCKERDVEKENWCLAFPCRCLPEFELDCSSFMIRTGSVDIEVPMDQLIDYADAHPVPTTKLNRQDALDLPYPEKHVRSDLTEYTSIQEEFPRTYKIGRTGIASKEPALRKAQAKQLKGYLLFYDQLLANYLAYLASVRTLLSVEKSAPDFYQTIYDVPGVRELLLDFHDGDDWNSFMQNENNPYAADLRQITEGNDTERNIWKNQVLDHLLARFGESFTDYVMTLYQIEKPVEAGDVWDQYSGLDESIKDKQRFLDNLPALGSQRSGSFNYRFDRQLNNQFWKTENVEGLRKRVCARLGIDNWTRHTITCEPSFVVEVGPVRTLTGTPSGKNKHEFYIKPDKQSTVRLLVSTAKFSSQPEAEKASVSFLNMAVDKTKYGIVNDNIIGFWPDTAEADRNTDNALLLEPKENPDNIAKRLEYLVNLASGNCEDDGFHILEHLLIRPRSDMYIQMLRPMVFCVDNLELMDPYSFWISVIVPDWSGRFKDPVQFNNFKQTVRMEAPAHLAIRFCILPREQLFEFEKIYYNWLKTLFGEKQEGLARTTDDLVSLMNGWDDTIIDYH